MTLPLAPPYPPMEARSAASIPTGEGWQYEPKWDGFRCLAFKDGGAVELQSKAGKPLTRYFPEVVRRLAAAKPRRFVLDGELIVPLDGRASFDDLLQRIHPAASRVAKLAGSHPALYVVFDLLVDERGRSLVEKPLSARRAALEKLLAGKLAGAEGLALSPRADDPRQALEWYERTNGDLDGVVAKRTDEPYRAGSRDAMRKIKNLRTADCVVGGFRWSTDGESVGSLLLGLYDDSGSLDHVGFTSGIKSKDRAAVTKRITKLWKKGGEVTGFTGNAPGGPSRWASDRSTAWEPLPHELVVEVSFDHFTGGRFRHGTRLVRWRPDKAPRQCTKEQVSGVGGAALTLVRCLAPY